MASRLQRSWVFRLLRKKVDDADLQQELLSALKDAAAIQVEPSRQEAGLPAEIWCGEKESVTGGNPAEWLPANQRRSPVFLSLLEPLAKTCLLLIELLGNRGLTKTGDASAQWLVLEPRCG